MNVFKEDFFLLPNVARERFSNAVAENKSLATFAEGQAQIISELSKNIENEDILKDKISNVERDIFAVDENIDQSIEALQELLHRKKVFPSDEILKSFLLATIRMLLNAMKESIDQEDFNVSLFQLIEIESKIAKTIQSLDESGMYIERSDQREKQVNEAQKHQQKIMQFLEALEEDVK